MNKCMNVKKLSTDIHSKAIEVNYLLSEERKMREVGKA